MLAARTVRRYTKAADMRVYLPSTLPALSQAHGAGELGPGPLEAYAVTPGLRAWCASDDEEELEYAALGRAARASLRLLAEASRSEAVPGRRVVIAVEVPDADVAADPDGAADSAVGGPVPRTRPSAGCVSPPPFLWPRRRPYTWTPTTRRRTWPRRRTR